MMLTRRQAFKTLAGFLFSSNLIKPLSAHARVLNSIVNQTTRPPHEVARDESFWRIVQSAYEIDRSILNLNNGGVCPAPRLVIDAVKRHIDYANHAPAYTMWQHQEPLIESVRRMLANMAGADPEEIAITRNASESLHILQMGIDLRPGDEVILTEHTYPRMKNAWFQRQRREGIKVKIVRVPTPLTDPDAFVDDYIRAMTPRTRALLISHIVNITGQILPVQPICMEAQRRGIFTIVDGAHAFAHFPFTVPELDCDGYGTSLHKWLSAPIGTGMLYVRRDRIRQVWPLMAATPEQDDDIRKFEEIGTHPAAIHNAIAEAVFFNQTIGIHHKAARLQYLNLRWAERIRDLEGVEFMTDLDRRDAWYGILVVNIRGINPEKLKQYLWEKHRIFVVAIKHERFEGIRVTPNVYTTVDEIDRFGDVIEAIARKKIKL